MRRKHDGRPLLFIMKIVHEVHNKKKQKNK